MNREINLIKGLHPGLYLDRKIREQRRKKGELALEVQEYPQTLSSITKGKRSMNTALALKLEKALGLEEGTLMILQIFHEIEHIKKKSSTDAPNLKKIRAVVFWDTDMRSIDWQRQYKAVIRRVFERGNKQEQQEITRFYGKDKIEAALKTND